MGTQATQRHLRDSARSPTHLRFRRRRQVTADYAKGKSTLYDEIRRGLWPTPIRLGANSVAWLDHEMQAVAAARVAGKSDDDIRILVQELITARAVVA